MIKRENKIKIFQTFLLLVCGLVVFLTYFNNNEEQKENIISSVDKKKIKKSNINSDQVDIFYKIRYSGLDLQGNRYVLTSEEAIIDKNIKEIVNMNKVNAIFYFKDNTKLIIDSDKGVYNNKTLDMTFEKNVKANYEQSELFGEKIVYLNSERTLEVSENVKLIDERGKMSADKLLFDLETKKVDISSYKDAINTNIFLK